jgi:sugar phosphate permease
MLRAAARRFSILLAALACGTALAALLVGVASGAAPSRSISVGLYVVGSVLLIGGFFVGNRGPARPRDEGWFPFSVKRWVRWATPDEQQESLSLSAILVVLGFVLIILGAAADTRQSLF